MLGARGIPLGWAEYVGDTRARIAATLRRAFASSDIVFCTGGIGATPDDHTRQAAAEALDVPLQLHEGARQLIEERMRDVAAEQGVAYEPARADNMHRLNMGVFPAGARLIPNPYNKIAGFSADGAGGGSVHFVPGFPVMAWPMIEWVLDMQCARWFRQGAWLERSVIVYGSMEASLTPLMEALEAAHPAVRVFSLPSVDHPHHGRHIELGLKGAPAAVESAWPQLVGGLQAQGATLGAELVRR